MKTLMMILASAMPFQLPESWKKHLSAAAHPLEVRNAGEEAEILLYDQIGESFFSYGVTAKGVVQMLAEIGDKPVNVRINSPGGDVFEGMAIYNALKSHSGTVRVTVDGLAASIASIIAMAGKTVSMAENSMMMIHNPFALTAGDAGDLRKTADLLDKIKSQMVDTYNTKSKIGKKELGSMMDEETWLTAKEAVANGMADEVATPGAKVSAKFDLALYGFRHVPEGLKAEEEPETPVTPVTPPPAEPTTEEKAAEEAANIQADKDRERLMFELA
jgi:ATP-dependent Clp protease protease subunit